MKHVCELLQQGQDGSTGRLLLLLLLLLLLPAVLICECLCPSCQEASSHSHAADRRVSSQSHC